MITQDTINKVVEAARIEEVAAEFLTLKRRGANFIAVCPFHTEKTGSLSISPAKNIYKCFGCGAVGDSITFVMNHEKFAYPEAIEWLASKYKITVEKTHKERPEEINKREIMFTLNNFATSFFQDNLKANPDPLNYLLSERAFTPETLAKWQIGYASNSYTMFMDQVNKFSLHVPTLIQIGLLQTRDVDGKIFDRYRDRITFPIHNLTGRICGFGARIIKPDPKKAKYINSPESEVYHKSNLLFGMYHAKRSISKEDECLVVEGYTDVISMHQHGIENVVASSGTSFTVEQIKLIKRFTNNITILFDGDTAGLKATIRSIELVISEGLTVRIVAMPEGEDPDSFARSNAQLFKEFIRANRINFVEYVTKQAFTTGTRDTAERALLINDTARIISLIPDLITRSLYIKSCSEIMNVSENILSTEVSKQFNEKHSEQFSRTIPMEAPAEKQPPSQLYMCECEIIKLLLVYADQPVTINKTETTVRQIIISELNNDDLSFTDPITAKILSEYQVRSPPADFFINHADQEIQQFSMRMIADNSYEPTEHNPLQDIVLRCTCMFKIKTVTLMLADIQDQLKQQINENVDYSETLKQISLLTNAKSQLTKYLGIVIH